jgi:glycosyltransferase involved in cell wall biosynthesis
MKKLSIAIPTYNRIGELADTLRALFSQDLDADVEIVVIDNCSDIVVEEAMVRMIGTRCSEIRFIRNNSNIGLAGNLLRALEESMGEWIWLLGDDDPPVKGSYLKIKSSISSATGNDVLIKFNSSNGGNVSEEVVLKSQFELAMMCRDPKVFSNLLFISSSVFRRESMVSRLGIGYQWCNTIAPHIAILMDLMNAGASVRFCPHEVVEHGRPEAGRAWNPLRLQAGFPFLADLESGRVFAEVAMPSILSSYLGKRWILKMGSRFLLNSDKSPKFWVAFYFRYAAIIGGWKGVIMIISTWAFRGLSSFGLARATASKFFSVKDPVVANLDRS